MPILQSLMSFDALATTLNLSELVGEAVLGYVARQPSVSVVRRHIDLHLTSFICKQETVTGGLPGFHFIRPQLRDYIADIPRVLWQIGGKDTLASAVLCKFLLDIGHRGGSDARIVNSGVSREHDRRAHAQTIQMIPSKLAAFYWIEQSKRPGPWSRLEDVGIRKLAVDLGKAWLCWDTGGQLRKALIACGILN